MRFDVITLFPELFAPFLASGVTRRAYESGAGRSEAVEPARFRRGQLPPRGRPPLWRRPRHGDDGRAAGALPGGDPRPTRGDAGARWCCFRPIGSRAAITRAWQRWSASAGAVLVCGRYEGIDQRFIDAHVDVQISLGDFVLSGGEIAAMALLDAVARLQPGVLNDEGSHQFDSFNPALDGLLDCPHYTRPEEWQGRERAAAAAVRPPCPDRALAPRPAPGNHRPAPAGTDRGGPRRRAAGPAGRGLPGGR